MGGAPFLGTLNPTPGLGPSASLTRATPAGCLGRGFRVAS